LVVFLVGSYGIYITLILPKNSPLNPLNEQNQPTSATINQDNLTASLPDVGDKIAIFYSTSCPHCQKVSQYLSDNKIEEKLDVLKLKVDDENTDKANIDLWFQKVQECNLGEESLGVPFMYHQGKCVIGDQPIIDYINSLIK